jgi:tetratricopeptide (TPR) repeat protein
MIRDRRGKGIENCIIVWLDEGKARDESGEVVNHYQKIVFQVQVFNDPNECIDYITEILHQRVFFVLSASMAHVILPLDIHQLPQIDSIYVFSSDKEEWAAQIPKVKGIFINTKLLHKKLRENFHQIERDLISFDLMSTVDSSDTQEATFMYAQLIKEIFLEMKDDNSIEEMLELIRTSYIDNPSQCELLDEFERDYSAEKAVNWYSRDSPLYRTINKAIRIQDVMTLYKMRTFIRHLHIQLAALYHMQKENRIITLYRGQRMSHVEFEQVKNNIGGLMSIKNFLSTTRNKDIALMFAGESDEEEVAILIEIEIDSSNSEPTSYFANIEQLSHFGMGEQEWLFSMGSVFRILNVEKMMNDHIWLVKVKITDGYDKQLNALTNQLRWKLKIGIIKPLHSFAALLFYMGIYKEANKYFNITLDSETDSENRMSILHNIGVVHTYLGTYQTALDIFHRLLELRRQSIQHQDDPAFGGIYYELGRVYEKMDQHDLAFEYFHRSLNIISNSTDPFMQILLTDLYNGIGSVCLAKNELDKALENYQQALNISIKNLPPTDLSIAVIYNNISQIYYRQGRYQEALDMSKKSLELKLASLPPDHPTMAIAYKNLALIYETATLYEDALLLYEQALNIELKQFSLDHVSCADTYDRIAMVYLHQGRKEDALNMENKSLNARIASLPADHQAIGISYNNLCTIFCHLKCLDEALACAHRALIIYQHNLSAKHPLIATLYSNMGSIYATQKNYEEALHMFQNALNIQLTSFSTTHPDTAIIYHNISGTLRSMNRLDEAFENGNKAVDISTRTLGSEHSQTKLFQYYLQLTKDQMS